jgi:hypothetical protein
VERGVRFVQLFHGGGGGGAWDAHGDIKNNHTTLAAQVDQPIAGLLKDLNGFNGSGANSKPIGLLNAGTQTLAWTDVNTAAELMPNTGTSRASGTIWLVGWRDSSQPQTP